MQHQSSLKKWIADGLDVTHRVIAVYEKQAEEKRLEELEEKQESDIESEDSEEEEIKVSNSNEEEKETK